MHKGWSKEDEKLERIGKEKKNIGLWSVLCLIFICTNSTIKMEKYAKNTKK